MLAVFTAALLASAFLLFWVQPMFAKLVLPMLGGTPSVWNTCMVFYQAALLAGYLYAHLSIKFLGVRRQSILHLALLGLVFIALPPGLPEGWSPAVESPVPWLLALLTVSVGLPIFVVSATAPMLQRWFSYTSHSGAKDPYFLYTASNIGSLAALAGYPVFLEPTLRLGEQAWGWAALYSVMALLISVCALVLWRSLKSGADRGSCAGGMGGVGEAQEGAVGDRYAYIRWVLLAFAPSSLLLGVTTYITTDIASVPLLWVVPLALYLLTFAIVFARRPLVSHALMVWAQPFLMLALAVLLLARNELAGPWSLSVHLLTFFVTAMVCHGELARSRPAAEGLTTFYLLVSLGGVLGGAFNSLVAPVVFDTVAEYPLAVVLACMLRPGGGAVAGRLKSYGADLALPLILFLFLGGLWFVHRAGYLEAVPRAELLILMLAGVLCFGFRNSSLRFGLGVAAILLSGTLWHGGKGSVIHMERSFFGVLRVREVDGRFRTLSHGTTLHGAQALGQDGRCEPLTYYHRAGPVGEVFGAFNAGRGNGRVAVIGLGTGSMAAYARPGEKWTLYEIDPAVERIALHAGYFTFLRDCPGEFDVVLGDARLTLGEAPGGEYGLIVLDAFSSDAIPVHLLTTEALELYLDKLAKGGMLAFHVSNRHLDLKPLLAALSGEEGLFSISSRAGHGSTKEEYRFASDWVVMARDKADLGGLAEDPGWVRLEAPAGFGLWTDDYSNILSVLK